MTVVEKRVFRIELDERLCKGCSICVDFCPTDVLNIEGNIVAVKDLDTCNGCQLCDNRVMRSGPSTGSPTGPSQGDVMQAKWGTHGDHPVIALTPASVEEILYRT